MENIHDILKDVYSDRYEWKGIENGDTLEKYQGRKLQQIAKVLTIVGMEMESGNLQLSDHEAEVIFYDHLRKIEETNATTSGYSSLDIPKARNLWKIMRA